MNIELLTCRTLTAGLIYPPIPVQPPDLNRLYADLTQRYPYQNLQHLPDGVRMANPDGECLVQIGRIQISENVMYFQASKEKFLDIFGMVCGRFNVQQFMTFGIKLTAFLPTDVPNGATEFLDRAAFAMNDRDWSALGSGRKGAGIRVVLHQDGIIDLKIEPFFNDTSQLYIEVDMQHSEPFNNLSSVKTWMDQSYDYLFGNVKSLLGELARRG
ncbi:MAG TPA: hypothetical protein VGK34_07600 [Armatimonadota bacterium]|jgi:hypothetical protein